MKFDEIVKIKEYSGQTFDTYLTNNEYLTDYNYWLLSVNLNFDFNEYFLELEKSVEKERDSKEELKKIKRKLQNELTNFSLQVSKSVFDFTLQNNLLSLINQLSGVFEGQIDFYLLDKFKSDVSNQKIDIGCSYQGNEKNLALFFKKLSDTYNADGTPVLKINSIKELSNSLSMFFNLNKATFYQNMVRTETLKTSYKMQGFDTTPFKKKT